MEWYNPLAYLAGKAKSRDDLYCASPSCSKIIEGDKMVYRFGVGVYHSARCIERALEGESRQEGVRQLAEFAVVSRREASELVQEHKGKPAGYQPRELERMVG